VTLTVDASMAGDRTLTVRLAGELEVATSHRLTDALGDWLDIKQFVVDLSECGFVDSSGVRALVICSHEVGAGRMRVIGARPTVERALTLAGLGSVLGMTVAEDLPGGESPGVG
jgi:anti-anti-sigma factor